MLFILDDEIIPYVEKNLLQDEEILAIEKLIISYIDKIHLLYISPKLIKSLLSSSRLSDNQKKGLEKILDFVLLQEGYLQIKKRVRVLKEISHCELKENEYVISLFDLNNSNYYSKPILICESMIDCNFYIKSVLLLEKYFYKNQSCSTHFNLEKCHGGGNDIYLMIKEKINEKRIFVSISDSDKRNKDEKYNNKKNQGTAHKVLDIKKNFVDGINCIKLTEVREKENLIPPKLYDFQPNASSIRDLISDLKYIYSNDKVRNCYYFMDVKDGLKYRTVNSCEATKNNLEKLYNTKDFDTTKFKHLPREYKMIEERLKKKCLEEQKVYDGIEKFADKAFDFVFGKKLQDIIIEKEKICSNKKKLVSKNNIKELDSLERDIENLKKLLKSLEDYQEFFCDILKKEWICIIDQIITYGCSPSPF